MIDVNQQSTRARRDPVLDRLYAAASFYRGACLLLLAIVVIETGVIVWQASRARFARAIRVDGEVACFVRNEASAEKVRQRLLADERGKLPGAAFLEQKWEDLNWPLSHDDKVLKIDEAVELLRTKVTIKVAAAAITSGEGELVALPDRDQADMVLTMLKNEYSDKPGKLIEAKFADDNVRIIDTKARPKAITGDVHKAVKALKNPREGVEKYVVVRGDSWRRIADQFKTTVSQLRKLNPRVKDPLQVGVSLTVSVPRSPVTVITVMEQSHDEEYKAEPQKIQTNTLPKGQQRVITETGSPGVRRITEHVTYRNGKESGRETKETVVVKKAEPQRIMVGTAEPAAAVDDTD